MAKTSLLLILFIAGGTFVCRLTLPSKILIPYGNIDRPDKLRHISLIGRLDGHQNFSGINWHA